MPCLQSRHPKNINQFFDKHFFLHTLRQNNSIFLIFHFQCYSTFFYSRSDLFGLTNERTPLQFALSRGYRIIAIAGAIENRAGAKTVKSPFHNADVLSSTRARLRTSSRLVRSLPGSCFTNNFKLTKMGVGWAQERELQRIPIEPAIGSFFQHRNITLRMSQENFNTSQKQILNTINASQFPSLSSSEVAASCRVGCGIASGQLGPWKLSPGAQHPLEHI